GNTVGVVVRRRSHGPKRRLGRTRARSRQGRHARLLALGFLGLLQSRLGLGDRQSLPAPDYGLVGIVQRAVGQAPVAQVKLLSGTRPALRLPYERPAAFGAQFGFQCIVRFQINRVVGKQKKHHAIGVATRAAEHALDLDGSEPTKQLLHELVEAVGCPRSASALTGTMVTLSPQPLAAVWFGVRNTNFDAGRVVS